MDSGASVHLLCCFFAKFPSSRFDSAFPPLLFGLQFPSVISSLRCLVNAINGFASSVSPHNAQTLGSTRLSPAVVWSVRWQFQFLVSSLRCLGNAINEWILALRFISSAVSRKIPQLSVRLGLPPAVVWSAVSIGHLK